MVYVMEPSDAVKRRNG